MTLRFLRDFKRILSDFKRKIDHGVMLIHTHYRNIVMEEDNILRPTKKGKIKATKMTDRTYITGVRLSEENKWKSKTIFSQLMEKQPRKLYKKCHKIIEKLYLNPQQQQQIYGQFSPNLKHGIVGNKSFSPNIFIAQNYLVAPFRIYYIYLPTKDITITSLSDLPQHINSRDNINAFMTQQMKHFDQRFEKTLNIKSNKDQSTDRKYITR